MAIKESKARVTSRKEDVESCRVPLDASDSLGVALQVDDGLCEVGHHALLRDLPHLHSGVVWCARDDLVIVGAPLDVHHLATVPRHLGVVSLNSPRLVTQEWELFSCNRII